MPTNPPSRSRTSRLTSGSAHPTSRPRASGSRPRGGISRARWRTAGLVESAHIAVPVSGTSGSGASAGSRSAQQRRPCRRPPPGPRSAPRVGSRRTARARRSHTACRGPAPPRRPGSGRDVTQDAGSWVDPPAVRGDRHGQRGHAISGQPVEEAATQQAQPCPTGDDSARAGPGVRLQDPLLDELVAHLGGHEPARRRAPPARSARLSPGGTGVARGVDAHRDDQSGHRRCNETPRMFHHRALPGRPP